MFIKHVKHYHQWLRTAILFNSKLEYKALQKDQALASCIQSLLSKNAIERVENVKSQVLQSPVPSTQASPKVEASHRPKQAQHFSKVQNGNSKVHQDLPDSRGMGIVDRPIGRLPSHTHPSKLKEIPKVLLQVPGVPVHLPPIRTSHSPRSLYNDCEGSEANGPLQRTQTSPIPGRLADQIPVSGGSPSEHSGSGTPNPALGLDNKLVKIRTETYSRLNGENGPGGTPSHEALSVSPQGALEISSVAGQPSSLDRSHCSTLRLVAKSLKRDERCRPSSQRPQYPTLYRRLKRRLGCSLRSKFYKGSVVRPGKRLHINVLELKAVSLALRSFKDQCQNQTLLVATDNSTVVAYINKQELTQQRCALSCGRS